MNWPGIFTAMVTPFAVDGSLSEGETERLADWLSRHGSQGLVVGGTTGESPALNSSERRRLFEAARRGVGARIPILVGAGSNNTEETTQRAREAENWGADGVMVVTPYYNKPPQEGLFQHYRAVVRAIGIPLMIYNVPARTGVSINPQTVARLAQEATVPMAVKEASGRIESIQSMIEACPEVPVYAGDDALFYPALKLGAAGVVSVASHVAGREMAQLLADVQAGHGDRAALIHQQLMPIFQGLFSWPNPVPVKWILNRLGHAAGPVRLPLVYPSDTTALHELLQHITSTESMAAAADDDALAANGA